MRLVNEKMAAMRNLLAVMLLIASSFPMILQGQDDMPAPILPDRVSWVSPPNLAGLHIAWILGSEQQAGAYILRVKLASGAKIPPHTHPDERNTTVLRGTIYVGFGEAFDESRLVAVPAGAVYVVPAGVPHYLWAKDGETMYQEAGLGPTGNSFVMQ